MSNYCTFYSGEISILTLWKMYEYFILIQQEIILC